MIALYLSSLCLGTIGTIFQCSTIATNITCSHKLLGLTASSHPTFTSKMKKQIYKSEWLSRGHRVNFKLRVKHRFPVFPLLCCTVSEARMSFSCIQWQWSLYGGDSPWRRTSDHDDSDTVLLASFVKTLLVTPCKKGLQLSHIFGRGNWLSISQTSS